MARQAQSTTIAQTIRLEKLQAVTDTGCLTEPKLTVAYLLLLYPSSFPEFLYQISTPKPYNVDFIDTIDKVAEVFQNL